jgi:hypothetical protein
MMELMPPMGKTLVASAMESAVYSRPMAVAANRDESAMTGSCGLGGGGVVVRRRRRNSEMMLSMKKAMM